MDTQFQVWMTGPMVFTEYILRHIHIVWYHENAGMYIARPCSPRLTHGGVLGRPALVEFTLVEFSALSLSGAAARQQALRALVADCSDINPDAAYEWDALLMDA